MSKMFDALAQPYSDCETRSATSLIVNIKPSSLPRLYFSYNQFMVYDQSVQLPGCDWTDDHFAQGFARRESVVNFNALLEFGYADVEISFEPYQPKQEDERVIAVPFHVMSGKVVVEGPEET